MKISTKGRNALRLLVDLTEHGDEDFIALKDVAKRQDISKKYPEQIVSILNKTGILKKTEDIRVGINLRKYLKNILLAIFIALLRAVCLLFPVLDRRKIFVKGATFVQPCLLGRDSIRLSMITLIVFSAKLFRSQQTISSSLITSSKKEVIVLITSFYYDFIFLLLFHFSLV